ncbi:MAG: universal stress protein [Candidatus Rokuibacteriota bacterium]
MYRTILLAAAFQNWEHNTPHARAARDVAATLARHAERLHVLTVYERELIRIPTGVPAEMAAKLREQQTDGVDRAVAEKMDDYVGPLLSQGLPIAKIVRLGSSPRHLIIEVAQEVDADLLVIGSHSKRGLLDIALGGTARHVSEHAPCPVVMVAPKAKK